MKRHGFWKVGTAVGVLWLSVAAMGAWAEEPASSNSPIQAEKAALKQLYKQASQAAEKGEDDRAIALLTQILERDPQQAVAYRERAWIYGKQNRTALAIADYRQAIALDPKNASAYGGLGWSLVVEGRFEEAREPTEKAHAQEPDNFAWTVNLGNLALLAGDREQARLYYRQGLEQITSIEQFEEGPLTDLGPVIN